MADANREAAWISVLAPHFAKYQAHAPEKLREIYKSFLEDDEMLEVFLELRPSVVSFHFGIPSQEKIDSLKGAGIVLLGTATNLAEAKELERSGIDAVVAQGYEAGGHRGVFDPNEADSCLSMAALVRLLVCSIQIPVIAAGGIMDGAGIAACLALGAKAVQLGTAFINCPESSADKFYRQALKSEAAYKTVMTRAISGRPARCLPNAFTELGQKVDQSIIPEYPIAYDAGKALNAVAKEAGDGAYGAQWAGQSAPLARAMPAADLIAQLKREIELTIGKAPEIKHQKGL
jgi:nitronate monooxygenase